MKRSYRRRMARRKLLNNVEVIRITTDTFMLTAVSSVDKTYGWEPSVSVTKNSHLYWLAKGCFEEARKRNKIQYIYDVTEI